MKLRNKILYCTRALGTNRRDRRRVRLPDKIEQVVDYLVSCLDNLGVGGSAVLVYNLLLGLFGKIGVGKPSGWACG
jgi:hypothetical protein